jgi:formate-dependent nitrite reductase membrane component NrfD
MFNLTIVCYVFLAGIGSGAYVIAAVFSVIGRRSTRDSLREYRIITRGAFWLGPLLVAFGTVFLVFDLAVPERAFTIFLSPKLTILGFGAWSLLLFCLLAGLSLFLHSVERVDVSTLLLRVVEVLTLLAALAVMVYTGVLVSSMPAVPFLHTPLLVVLFVVSSLSGGAALITLYGFFNQQRKSMRYGLRIISRIDLILIALELVALAALLAQKYLEVGVARETVLSVLFGEDLLAFWIGVVLLGILLPVALGAISRKTPQPQSAVTWAVSATALLIGAFALRYCLITGGVHMPVEVVL